MLRSLREIIGYQLRNGEESFGHSRDVLFDDHQWTIRYIDVDTGTFLPGRRILVSPVSLATPVWATATIPTPLTRGEIRDMPELSEDEPVSRQWEDHFFKHLGLPHYSTGGSLWGMSADRHELQQKAPNESVRIRKNDSHLRSATEVMGYSIHTQETDFGQLVDFVFDTESWNLRYLAIKTTQWLPGKTVLISPDWVTDLDWQKKRITVSHSEDEIRNSPEYDTAKPVNKEYEARLYDYYGRPRYWNDDREAI